MSCRPEAPTHFTSQLPSRSSPTFTSFRARRSRSKQPPIFASKAYGRPDASGPPPSRAPSTCPPGITCVIPATGVITCLSPHLLSLPGHPPVRRELNPFSSPEKCEVSLRRTVEAPSSDRLPTTASPHTSASLAPPTCRSHATAVATTRVHRWRPHDPPPLLASLPAADDTSAPVALAGVLRSLSNSCWPIRTGNPLPFIRRCAVCLAALSSPSRRIPKRYYTFPAAPASPVRLVSLPTVIPLGREDRPLPATNHIE
jgi:hypothetical protein